VKNLKDEGVITFNTQKGRHSAGTSFTYIPNKTFEIEYDNELKRDLEYYPEIEEKKA